MNITFIGMSGAGKSYVGSAFAVHTGIEFVDIDRQMEGVYEGRPLQEILDEIGEERFLAEQEAQVKQLAGRDGLVVSPGGSVVYTEGAMLFLKEFSTIVYLQVPLATIKQRIASEPRGIVGLGSKTFDELYSDRSALYEKWADVVVDAGGKTPEEIIEELSTLIQSN